MVNSKEERVVISRVFVLVFPFVGSKISKKMMFFSLSLNWIFKEKLCSVSFCCNDMPQC